MKPVSASQAFDNFKPENVVFVLSYDKKNKRPSGMVAGWSMKCSFKPRLFAVALWEKGYTHKLIQQTKEFVVAVPNRKLEKAIDIFGKRHGNKVDKFKLSKVKTLKAKHVDVPLLADATINLECKLEKEVKAGDHFIFIGKVVAAYLVEGKKVLLNWARKTASEFFGSFKKLLMFHRPTGDCPNSSIFSHLVR